jgi:leucyl-tRNA synthetase
MHGYDHKNIEQKWQKRWKESELYKTDEQGKEKCFVLDMFPYPSGDGLHVGHSRVYIAGDIYSRYKSMNGYSVLHPMGWDAFGLPAENYAIKNKIHPRVAVDKNIVRFRKQLEKLGFNYDWDREINTTDPSYYKWTQWIFLKLYEKGLAYESNEPINWCPSCLTGLANEDLDGDKCERCGSVVEKKPIRQWVLKITDYAERMLNDLELLPDWPEYVKELQRNWIGRSEGAEIEFPLSVQRDIIKIFTTRPDTIFGATYMVLSPEHSLVSLLRKDIKNWSEVEKYIEVSDEKSDMERTADGKEKTGVRLDGAMAINPANKEEIPIFVADYVLAHYGTGAIMAVPAHDRRDLAFAKKFNLPVKQVILGGEGEDIYTGEGILVNSQKFDGMTSEEAKGKIIDEVGGKMVTTYKLRDWVFSRQRYWGEPIPIIHCEKCGVVPVSESDLPVVLPEVESYEPTGTGESPLAGMEEWVNVECPKCGGRGKRETNTMPQWAGSSWYYLRYMDPINSEVLVSKGKEKYWAPVDMYVGGMEHATRHLIYARFWHKFLNDIGVVSTKEPFRRLETVGLIHAEDGRKMSKRWGNVINPDDIVERLGADTMRIYEMFMGPFEQGIAWSNDNLAGARRFLEKVWRARERVSDSIEVSPDLERVMHQSIKKVGEDIEAFKFNTAISQLMVFINALEKEDAIPIKAYMVLLSLLAPFAPHITEELWDVCGMGKYTSKFTGKSIHLSAWPSYDENKIRLTEIVIAVQIDGKTRGTVVVQNDATKEVVLLAVREEPRIAKWLTVGEPKKVVYVKNRLLSIVNASK